MARMIRALLGAAGLALSPGLLAEVSVETWHQLGAGPLPWGRMHQIQTMGPEIVTELTIATVRKPNPHTADVFIPSTTVIRSVESVDGQLISMSWQNTREGQRSEQHHCYFVAPAENEHGQPAHAGRNCRTDVPPLGPFAARLSLNNLQCRGDVIEHHVYQSWMGTSLPVRVELVSIEILGEQRLRYLVETMPDLHVAWHRLVDDEGWTILSCNGEPHSPDGSFLYRSSSGPQPIGDWSMDLRPFASCFPM
ncbi:MAG: hypothetical protein JJU31_14145 [Wenzhouxiangella sp.]|nr:hypothetical protein [Wenzhouxiangella sp.]